MQLMNSDIVFAFPEGVLHRAMFDVNALFDGALDQVDVALDAIGQFHSHDGTSRLFVYPNRIALNQMVDDIFTEDLKQSAKLIVSMIESHSITDKIGAVGLNMGVHLGGLHYENSGEYLCQAFTTDAFLNNIVALPEDQPCLIGLSTVFQVESLWYRINIEPSKQDDGESLFVGLNAQQNMLSDEYFKKHIWDEMSKVKEYSYELIERCKTAINTPHKEIPNEFV